MAHELEWKDGRYSFIYVGQSAWHRGGTEVPFNIGYDEGLALMRVDYPVESRKVALLDANGQPTGESRLARVTVRTDNGYELGRVSPHYKPIQNVTAFRPIRALMDEGVARLECGGVLSFGRMAWILVNFNLDKFPEEVQKALYNDGDQLAPYGCVLCTHDGSAKVRFQATTIRAVCRNTIGMMLAREGVENHADVDHSGDVEAKVEAAGEQVFGAFVDRFRRATVEFEILKSTRITPDQFTRIVLDTVAPDPTKRPGFNVNAPMARVVLERVEAKRNRLTHLWKNGTGHTGEETAWWAYNALVEGLDHDSDIWPGKGPAWRTQSLMVGAYADAKRRVFDGLMNVARAEHGGALAGVDA